MLGWVLAIVVAASPERSDLIEAWAASFGPEAELSADASGGYHLVEPQLDYDGPVVLVGARVTESYAALDPPVTHQGLVDFRLPDLDENLAESMLFYDWLSDRQNFYFLADEQRWIAQDEYTRLMQAGFPAGGSWGFIFGFLPVVVIIAVLVAAIVLVGRQMFKARTLMSDSFEINRMARENLEQARELQETQAELQQKLITLATRQTELLEEIRDGLDSLDR